MIDFLMISTRSPKRGVVEIYPKFIIKTSSDLMIRGGDFYAIWMEDRGLWSTDEQDVIRLIDRELDNYAEEHRSKFEGVVRVLHMWDAETGMIDNWHKYCQRQMRDSYHMLDERLIFSNTETSKKDYASKRLNYPLESCDTPAWNELVGTLYSEEERMKIEWAIGSIVNGASKTLEKFLVLYGGPGTGKGTIIKVVKKLFGCYTETFDAKALGSSSGTFALEAFSSNPLVAIDADGKLSRIEDNTRLNLLVSHEPLRVNEKYKSTYTSSFKAFLIMASNSPVQITDAKSGLIRRLIDVVPTGNKIAPSKYNKLMKQIDFELGGIASHCLEVFEEHPARYDNYTPITMLGATNDFYNFVLDSYIIFKREDSTTLKAAWEMYKNFCEEAKVPFPYSQRVFKEELRNYFREYDERYYLEDGTRVRSYYSGFRDEKFEEQSDDKQAEKPAVYQIEFSEQKSIFDDICADCPAQYANDNETPTSKWDNVRTKLSDISTIKLHYVKVPENHIVIDFDIPDKDGNKSFELNLKEASKWPPTYAELSKSGQGIHLHYIYTGDPTKLSRVYDDHIEVKVFTGKSSLRRKLTKCNDIPIASISSGLPLKGEKEVINFDGVMSEKRLRTQIKRNLAKEYHAATKPSVDFIYKILEDAYKSDLKYDVTDMKNMVLAFAAKSTHQADYCIKLVNKMHFKSEESSPGIVNDDAKLVFYDVEVFPNLFLVNWKFEGEGNSVVRMINPKPSDIEELIKYRLVGFNCRRYDNHILYGRLLGKTNEELYDISQKIVNNEPGAFFGEAYNISYTDIYDFSSKKQSLKKFEIELGIHHQELGLPWDKPVPEELWTKVAEYCDNDVVATEATFNARKADFTARRILADVAGMTVNDTTNTLTTKIIFGNNRNPQGEFSYRDMGDTSQSLPFMEDGFDEFTQFDAAHRPIFPGYIYDRGKSTYRGEEVGEGGYVYSEPGMYSNIALLDIASMHPSSIVAEQLFGPNYTQRFNDILQARIAIKHHDFDAARKMLGGALAKYLDDESAASDLAKALKIAINSVYGLTSAGFKNPFKDPRNKDNIVAKRGALFMVNLKHEVQKRGFIVAHIKTDSIKIPDATPQIIAFVMEYGKMYGYNFEHEATYDRMCLVNDAVYIAKYKDAAECERKYGYIPGDNRDHSNEWTATGTQFQVPYVFKTLFSKENIEFKDMCETKSVTSALYLDLDEQLEHLTAAEEKELTLIDGAWHSQTPLALEQAANRLGYSFEQLGARYAELCDKEKASHDYHFVGKVGEFCPIKPGCGGGELLREAKDKDGDIKYASATGAKGYRWLESEMVKSLKKENDIDRKYYNHLVDDAVEAMAKYGDVERFTAEEPFISEFTTPWFGMNPPEDEDFTPFDVR